ncbi:MAG: hypothetical protein O7B81_17155, partial [Gammaproteobacteria bacterium]|nr:hypothetical protein [Gammaproteobacteria bacterium]
MKAILVRIGVDHSYGAWNAPADPISRRFLYVPIPERAGTRFHHGCKRIYRQLLPALHQFAAEHGLDAVADLGWPTELEPQPMHLDPDFDHLTYGDDGAHRGSHIRTMAHGDLVVFYAGLRSILPDDARLIYALVGLFVVDEVVPAADVSESCWDMNAHTRKMKRGASDIVVRAIRGQSGRFVKFIPIGDFRDRAYRVRKDLLVKWGDLTVRDGYLQRSARPPRFLHPRR